MEVFGSDRFPLQMVDGCRFRSFIFQGVRIPMNQPGFLWTNQDSYEPTRMTHGMSCVLITAFITTHIFHKKDDYSGEFRDSFISQYFLGSQNLHHFFGFHGIYNKALLIKGLPSRKLTYPPKNAILKMIFLFPRWDMLIPWRVLCTWFL